MATERTFIMTKPHGVAKKIFAKIIERFEQRGYKLVAMKFMQADIELLNQHYADLCYAECKAFPYGGRHAHKPQKTRVFSEN